MPYYTKAQIDMIVDGENEAQYTPEPDDAIDQVLDAAKTYLTPLDYSTEDVLEGMVQAMRHGRGDFGNMFHEDFEKMFTHLSKQFPEAIFRMRCVGAEFGDVYLREFAAGKISLSIGPFETE
jgi:hypothetical protein